MNICLGDLGLVKFWGLLEDSFTWEPPDGYPYIGLMQGFCGDLGRLYEAYGCRGLGGLGSAVFKGKRIRVLAVEA